MSFTNGQLAQKMSDLIGYWSDFAKEYADWLGGSATGGPSSNGLYPLTDWNGSESLVKCPAKLQADVDGQVSSASASASAAAASAAAASGSASTATTQAGLADTARIAAELAETNAETAETSAVNASVTAVAQANLATDRAGYASEWAITVEDTLVSVAAGGNGTTDYSSLHWAAKSDASATASAASAAAALVSETNAAASEAAAATFDPALYMKLDGTQAMTAALPVETTADTMLTLKDTGNVGGNLFVAFQSWLDSADVRQGFFGFASSGNEDIYLWNEAGGGININCAVAATGAVTGSNLNVATWDNQWELNVTSHLDDYAFVMRNSANPALYVVKDVATAGPIARFLKADTATGVADTENLAAQVQIEETGGITATGEIVCPSLDVSDVSEMARLNIVGDTSGNTHFNWSSGGENYITHKTAQQTFFRSYDGVSAYTTVGEFNDNGLSVTGQVTATGILQTSSTSETNPGAGNARLTNRALFLNGKSVVEQADTTWLRLNQAGNFTSGIFTPNNFRVDGKAYHGSTSYIANGTTGSIRIADDAVTGSPSVDIGCRNTSYCHLSATTGRFYFYDNVIIAPTEDVTKSGGGNYLHHASTAYDNDQNGAVTFGTAAATGGANGDIHFKY